MSKFDQAKVLMQARKLQKELQNEIIIVEAGEAQVEASELQVVELEAQEPLVPLGVLARPVVHQPVGSGLRRRRLKFLRRFIRGRRSM